ncbi:NTP pyrophosphohydrolases including oxidative damage repair enzymes [Moorella thermoacetica Y72]|uniref:NTP pyrophosphohydrolases including oxidative damage repair enzymes n=1 Tax=Moorella thermoacetica Y72 TaxID=1325331 RepID=A0A0S6U944_NEOTH|nr:NTP pyrophosphohydrolases including oxidative damage repair enzymes [Moorella thermoacetica Y72]
MFPFSEPAMAVAATPARTPAGQFLTAAAGADFLSTLLRFPFMTAAAAAYLGAYQVVVTTLYPDGFAVNQGVGNLIPGRIQNAHKGRPGYSHTGGAILLFQTLFIFQADGFQLFYRQNNLFQFPQRYGCRFKIGNPRQEFYPPANGRSWHFLPPFLCEFIYIIAFPVNLCNQDILPAGLHCRPLGRGLKTC